MRKKTVIILVAIILFCLTLVTVISIIVAGDSLTESNAGLGELLIFGAFCLIPLTAIFGSAGWLIYHTMQSRKTAVRLGESLGLDKLNPEEKNPMKAWYGGMYDGRFFAIKPVVYKGRSYIDGQSRPVANFYLRVVMELLVDAPLGIVVYRSPQEKRSGATFEEIFPTIKNGTRLNSSARNALLAFAQQGYETGLHGATYQIESGVRNLTLRDRAGVPEIQLNRQIMPHVHVILTHDHPYPNLNGEELNMLLEEMTAVARSIEP